MQLHKEVAISESNTSPLISSDKVIIKHDVYILTPEELLELKKKWAADAFDAGDTYRTCVVEDWDGSGEGDGSTPNKTTYINSLSIE